MFLKSLTLKGFKSFADKSTLNLEPGIIAIVGPNGSGKSNISDAVLWVLGERNAKNLRGSAMEDVIFSGSSARKATGYAEVELVLDNSDGVLPVEYREVVITRRMYRSGESEYLINGSVSRRMDILDILHDSGLGTGTHSIISQGSLDSVLQSKPEDRRALIEEAAGVLKHKQRMARSDRKLEKMAHHVERVSDVVFEVQRQLGPLERKAKRAKTYFELIDQKNRANLLLAVDDLRNLQKKWDELLAQENLQAADVEKKKVDIDAFEREVEELQEQVRIDNLDAGELSKRQRAASSILERIDSIIMMIRDRRRSALSRSEELKVSIEQSRLAKESRTAERAGLEQELAQHRSQKETVDAKIAELSDLHRISSEELEGLEGRIKDISSERLSKEKQIKDLTEEQAQQKDALTNGLAHIKVIENHAAELELQVARATADAKEAQRESDATQEVLSKVQQQESAARALVGTCTVAWQDTREVLKEAQNTEQSLAAQIQALEEFEESRTTASNEAMAWVTAQSADDAIKADPLRHAIKADSAYDVVLEAVLGFATNSLIVDSDNVAREIAQGIAANDKSGEVILAPRTFEGASSALKRPSSPSCGYFLIDRIDYKEQDKDAVFALLGDVVICRDIEEAISAHTTDECGYRFVTLDGSIVFANGVISLGTMPQSDISGTLAQARRLDELKSSLVEAQGNSKAAIANAEAAEESLREAQQESLRLSESLAQIKGTASSLKRQADDAAEKLATLTREYEDLQKRKEESQKIIDEARPAVGNIEEQLSIAKAELEKLEEEFTSKTVDLEPKRASVQELANALSEVKLEAMRLAERISYTERVVGSHAEDIAKLESDLNAFTDLLGLKTASASNLKPLIELFDILAQTARRRAARLDEETEVARSSSAGLHTKIADMRRELHGMHEIYDAQNEKLSNLRVEKARMEMQVQTAVSAIVDDCATPLDIALTEPVLENRPEVEEEAFKLNRRIANLGTINPDAAEEYDELKKRYDFLEGQLNDLRSASSSLRRINKMIEARIRDDFARTFEEVNENFQDVFTSLFPGGRANLELVDPDDMENSGVEVNAQPKGKRISKMTLMSGGEKSLTALALLFALYRTRSTPFYILDEVEAALDDTNLRRLIAFIDKMRSSTQLIMITHQRRTMETADILFGVSMQADGVTKVISQKLEHALKHAE